MSIRRLLIACGEVHQSNSIARMDAVTINFGRELVVSGMGLGSAIVTFFWNGDEAVTVDTRHWLSAAIKGDNRDKAPKRWSEALSSSFDRIYSSDPLRPRFILLSLLTTILSMAFFLATYLFLQPGLYDDILNNPLQRSRVFQQVFSIGLFANAFVDYLCLAYFRDILFQIAGDKRNLSALTYVAKDAALKVFAYSAYLANERACT